MATDGDATDTADPIDRRTRGGTSRLADSRQVLPPQTGKSPGSSQTTDESGYQPGWMVGWMVEWNGREALDPRHGGRKQDGVGLFKGV